MVRFIEVTTPYLANPDFEDCSGSVIGCLSPFIADERICGLLMEEI